MSVNSTATFLRQKCDDYKKKFEKDTLKSVYFNDAFISGYLRCIKDLEDFGD